MIAVTFAIPQESRAFFRGLKRQGSGAVLVVHTGIGFGAAERAVASLLAEHTPAAIIAAGFAGALDPRLRIGDVLVATNYTDPAFVERCRERWKSDARIFFGDLTTCQRVAESVEEKAELARATNACAVDMETSAISAACAPASVPLLALRVISDTAGAPLPLPFSVSYDIAAQRPRPLAVARHLALHPRSILPLAQFIRDLSFARRELARRLGEILPAVRSVRDR